MGNEYENSFRALIFVSAISSNYCPNPDLEQAKSVNLLIL
ncbi:Uncharacterized protein dnm_028870 [Desulfonema magnum]|uniref:Uncharacterized protein n=1 Tax=Desulfonema magnum TaxID=45655 RepID=A0A975GMJ3_9BACT|nr:Uncharacterized protein dnm_028870 [Desulfonema magnum]